MNGRNNPRSCSRAAGTCGTCCTCCTAFSHVQLRHLHATGKAVGDGTHGWSFWRRFLCRVVILNSAGVSIKTFPLPSKNHGARVSFPRRSTVSSSLSATLDEDHKSVKKPLCTPYPKTLSAKKINQKPQKKECENNVKKPKLSF